MLASVNGPPVGLTFSQFEPLYEGVAFHLSSSVAVDATVLWQLNRQQVAHEERVFLIVEGVASD